MVRQKAEIEVIELKSQWELFMDLLNKNNNIHFNFTTHFSYLLAVSWSKATKASILHTSLNRSYLMNHI